MTSPAFWDKLSRKYAESQIKDQESYEYTLGRTQSYLKPSDKVLEIGCGTGSTALQIAPSVAHVTATDFSGGMIEIAKEKQAAAGVQNVSFEVANDAEAGTARQFDAVLAFNLLHLMPNAADVVKSMASQVKPGGFVITKTACLASRAWIIRPMLAVVRLIGKAPEGVSFFSHADIDVMMKDAGLEILETAQRPAPMAYYVVARRR